MILDLEMMLVIDKQGRKTIRDASGHVIELEETVRELKATRDQGVYINLRADDGRHELVGFDYKTAVEICRGKGPTKGFICLFDGRKCNVYNPTAKGEWCILGTLPDGTGTMWNNKGANLNGDETLQLYLQIEVKQEEAAPEAAPAPEDAPPAQEEASAAGTDATGDEPAPETAGEPADGAKAALEEIANGGSEEGQPGTTGEPQP